MTSLPLSKQLYEKGLKIETEKWWVKYYDKWQIIKNFENDFYRDWEYYPAPSTDELLAVMPKATNQDDWELEICTEFEELWCIQYINVHTNTVEIETQDKEIAEALGKMCLFLLSNGYVYDEQKKLLVRKEEGDERTKSPESS